MYMSVILYQRMTMQVHMPFTVMVVRMHMPAFSTNRTSIPPRSTSIAPTPNSAAKAKGSGIGTRSTNHRPDQQ
jgi:hypothetical protein